VETELVECSAVLLTCDCTRFRAPESSSMQICKAFGGGTSAMMRLLMACRATSNAKYL